MKLFLATLGIVVVLLASQPVRAQSTCLTPDDVKTLMARVNATTPVAFNKKLSSTLVKMANKHRLLLQEVVQDGDKDAKKRLAEESAKDRVKFCEMLKVYGWPTTSLVDKEGLSAAFHLLRNTATYELQRDLIGVVLAASKTDENQKPEFAALLDRLRVSAGMKQVFGTLATGINGFLVLYPIEDEAHVEARRKEFGLLPLPEYLRHLERIYRTPIVRAHDAPDSALSDSLKKSLVKTIDTTLLDAPEVNENDVIRVDTNLVSLDVSVFNSQMKAFVGNLQKDDFKIFEDGQEEALTYFASTDVPFDLVLLIDLSGSTADKRDLIRKSTQLFIEAARPSDRVAIVTFSDVVNVLSPLTKDRSQLLQSIDLMNGEGASNIWDALKFSLDVVVGPRTLERRRAIIMMTDGVDNALMFYGNGGSKISFTDLLEAVRGTDVLIVPIYLDTESDYSSWGKSMYENARKTLGLLANESGGTYYKAKKISDLNGVYEQVINDLGKVYSLGYKPVNEKRDGSWRRVVIQIANRPDLIARARPGYYAR